MKIVILAAAILGFTALHAQGLDVPTPTPAPAPAPLPAPKADPVVRMDPYQVRALSIPAPTIVIQPMVRSNYAGQQVELAFVVDKNGRPYNIDSVSMMTDRDLVCQLASAIRGWQFRPAQDANGNPIEQKVILPVVISASS